MSLKLKHVKDASKNSSEHHWVHEDLAEKLPFRGPFLNILF